jgi:hypothetical protein
MPRRSRPGPAIRRALLLALALVLAPLAGIGAPEPALATSTVKLSIGPPPMGHHHRMKGTVCLHAFPTHCPRRVPPPAAY